MAILKDVETLFGYARSESLAKKSLMQGIVDELFPGHVVLGLIAIGQEGAVVKAKHNGREYAIKIAHVRFVNKKEDVFVFSLFRHEKETRNQFRDRFLRGCELQRILAEQIELQNIDFVLVPGEIEVVESPHLAVKMKFVHGINLLRFLQENKNLRVTMRLYLKLLDCVKFFHSCKIINRDLKPENIIVTGDSLENPRLCFVDWTAAKALSGDYDITLPGDEFHTGTLPYASKKLAFLGDSYAANESDDIFGCGVMLWEFFNFNKVPPPENPRLLLSDENIRERYIERLAKGIPESILEIFLRATAEDEKKRYNRIEPFMFELEKAMMEAGFFEEAEAENLDFFSLRKLVLEHEKKLRGKHAGVDTDELQRKAQEAFKNFRYREIAIHLYRAMLEIAKGANDQ